MNGYRTCFFPLQSWRMNCRRSFTIEKCQRREMLEFNTRLSSKTWRWVQIVSVIFMCLSALIPHDVLVNIVLRWSHLLPIIFFSTLRLPVLSLTNSSHHCSLCKWIRTHYFHARQWMISVNEHDRPLHSTRGSSSSVLCKLSPKRDSKVWKAI